MSKYIGKLQQKIRPEDQEPTRFWGVEGNKNVVEAVIAIGREETRGRRRKKWEEMTEDIEKMEQVRFKGACGREIIMYKGDTEEIREKVNNIKATIMNDLIIDYLQETYNDIKTDWELCKNQTEDLNRIIVREKLRIVVEMGIKVHEYMRLKEKEGIKEIDIHRFDMELDKWESLENEVENYRSDNEVFDF
ncbi:hypothetical protein [Inoviridae sp.]|nr:hypothetical protein [Inoviridae sp.]